ncbi:MAG TPA: hypothetical protein PLA50_11350, partial [Bacteroidia bacterium]|nr:hypothetical protein [Bacteroidia bacterium]
LNGDTRTDAEEIATALRDFLAFYLNDHFIKLDANRDGKLSLREYALSMPTQGTIGEDGADWQQRIHFKKQDKDGSGFIEMEEHMVSIEDSIHRRGLRCLLMFQLAGHD